MGVISLKTSKTLRFLNNADGTSSFLKYRSVACVLLNRCRVSRKFLGRKIIDINYGLFLT